MRRRSFTRNILFFLVLFSPFLRGCGTSEGYVPLGDESATEVAASLLAGTVNATESGGNFARKLPAAKASLFARLFSFQTTAWADGSSIVCPTVLSGVCSSGKMTLTFTACSFEMGGKTYDSIWTGGQVLTFEGGATCSVIPTANSSGTMTRTMVDKTTRTGVRGLSMEFNTTETSGYDSSVVPQPSGGAVMTFSSTGRTLDFRGFHITASYTSTRGNNRGETSKVWDYTLSTEAGFNVVGSAQNRTITAGTMIVQDNIRKFTAKAKVDESFKFTALCCYPVGGKMKSDLTGSRTGTESLAFGPNCGEAKLTDISGSEKSVTLRHCL